MTEIMQLLLELSSAIKEIKAQLLVLKQTRTEQFKQNWIEGQEVMFALKISKRTLQSLRDAGTLPYSRINGKFYYKIADLEKLLESNYSGNLKNESHD
ncbi:helix-turn-helix domain-containing protein [Prolixibacteraceae bacterium Z1-6]|uniref:Helix-turn-helix domain-containing protein n=1 Tax=Draconibacterium aestuarii TaxID=2998507 RepID=A0A9X3FBA9_9BACT|nr:helix-turn-helix domain-containing protein [Prolixibacteraceae bacterium Z1-6]